MLSHHAAAAHYGLRPSSRAQVDIAWPDHKLIAELDGYAVELASRQSRPGSPSR